MNITKESLGAIPTRQCYDWCYAQHFFKEFDGLALFTAAFFSYAITIFTEYLIKKNDGKGHPDNVKRIVLIHNFLMLLSLLMFAAFYIWLILKWKMQVNWL